MRRSNAPTVRHALSPMVASSLLVLGGVIASHAIAQVYVAPRGNAIAGQTVSVEIAATNGGSSTMVNPLGERLRALIAAGGGLREVVLEAETANAAGPAGIEPGGFHARRYRLTLPAGVQGALQFDLADLGTSFTMVVASPSAPIATPSASGGEQAVGTAPTASSSTSVAAPGPAATASADASARRDDVISTFEPMYFIAGTRGGTSAKMQLSFKHRLFGADSWPRQRVPALGNVHFGYTQTSLWDIGKESAPFRDTSYRPSLFYLEPDVWHTRDQRGRLSISAGVEHESNGKDGDNSRSLNTVFVRPRYKWSFDGDKYLSIWPKLVYYIEKSDNSDIRRYRGYGELNLRAGDENGIEASATWRKGTSTFGSVQLDLSYPLRRQRDNAGGFIFAQYFHGYGESLIEYNVKRRSQFRLGYAIVR